MAKLKKLKKDKDVAIENAEIATEAVTSEVVSGEEVLSSEDSNADIFPSQEKKKKKGAEKRELRRRTFRAKGPS